MSQAEVYLPARRVPVIGDYDVVVCGGGPAGCAAALSAARHGAKTILLESEGYLGGAPVTQLVTPILSTNGVDFQGVWHEFMAALRSLGGVSDITREHRFSTNWYVGSVDPELVKHAWDHLLSTAGVALLHHVLVSDAMVENGAITGVVLETKAGTRVATAKRVIDCTGDGDICARAGVPWEQGAHGKPWAMGVALNWRVGRVPNLAAAIPGRGVPGGTPGIGRTVGLRPECSGGLNRLLKVDPCDPYALSAATRAGRARVLETVREKQRISGNENIYLIDTASRLGVRSSRRIHGLHKATADDAWNLNKYRNGIARCSWEIDIHSAEHSSALGVEFDDPNYIMRVRRIEQGDYFDIHYGCLVATGIDNLLMAGRCISADHQAQACLRIQQTCMSTGQAAGTAAALSISLGVFPRNLDPIVLVTQLKTDRERVSPAFDILHHIPIAQSPE